MTHTSEYNEVLLYLSSSSASNPMLWSAKALNKYSMFLATLHKPEQDC